MRGGIDTLENQATILLHTESPPPSPASSSGYYASAAESLGTPSSPPSHTTTPPATTSSQNAAEAKVHRKIMDAIGVYTLHTNDLKPGSDWCEKM